MRIGLTGATGVLGKTLTAHWKGPEFIPFKGDISQYQNVKDWNEEYGPFDGVLHLAAIVPVDQVKADPLRAFEVNVGGTLNLLEVLRKIKAEKSPWIFYCSSSHIYENSKDPLDEKSPINPVSLYGLTKAQADKWCEVYRSQYNLNICTGRVFSNSSPSQASSYFLPSMIRRITEAPKDATLEVRGLQGTRDFLTTVQIVKAIEFLFQEKIVGDINIGTGTGIKLLDLVYALQKKLGREDINIKSIESETVHLVANVGKLKGVGLSLAFNLDEFLNYILGRPNP